MSVNKICFWKNREQRCVGSNVHTCTILSNDCNNKTIVVFKYFSLSGSAGAMVFQRLIIGKHETILQFDSPTSSLQLISCFFRRDISRSFLFSVV